MATTSDDVTSDTTVSFTSPEPTTGTTHQTGSEIGSADQTTPPLTTSDAATSATTTSPEPTTGTTRQTGSEIGSADQTTPPLTTSDAATSATTTSSEPTIGTTGRTDSEIGSADQTTPPLTTSDDVTSATTTSPEPTTGTTRQTSSRTLPLTTSDAATSATTTNPEPTTGTASQTSSWTLPLTTSDAVTSTTTISSSFPVAIIGVLVGVVVVCLVLILIGGVVIMACFLRRRRIKRIKTKLVAGIHQIDGDGMELNSCNSTMRNCHYQEAHQILNETGQHPPPLLPMSSSLWGGVTPSGTSTFHPITPQKGAGTIGKPPHTISVDGLMAIKTEVDGAAFPTHECDATSDSQYSTIDNVILEKEEAVHKIQSQGSDDNFPSTTKASGKKASEKKSRKRAYSIVRKKNPPVVPSKSDELCLELQATSGMGKGDVSEEGYYSQVKDIPKVVVLPEDEEINPAYVSSENLFASRREDLTYSSIDDNIRNRLTAKPVFLGSYSEIQRQSDDEEETYTEMKGNVLAKRHVTSGPIVLTASAVSKGLEVNPEYESTDTLMKVMDNVRTKTLSSAKAALQSGSESVYKTIHTEQIEPSMFMKAHKSGKNAYVVSNKGPGDSERETIYGPIYSPISPLDPGNFRRVLEFTEANVRKIRTLGTGFFGKVVLADTVGVSLKDLGLSDTDDDKSMFLRVAVKQLRQNPSPDRREAFYKELKFMSQLDHPNVIHTLGACTVNTPFIVMEYMEKGDLNQYLQDFDTIEQGSAPPTDLTISVGTLVSMSAQIADAMKYLASRNYIHRDLATRNCLVGQESRIKITDFGMSKNLYRSHYYFMSAHAILPIRWMAKECFYGKFSAKTDVWSFGVTMWEVFTLGKDIPYEDMDDSEVVADASDEGNRQLLKKPKDCPDDVYEVMMLCWEEEPKDRATFEKLHETLSSLCNT